MLYGMSCGPVVDGHVDKDGACMTAGLADAVAEGRDELTPEEAQEYLDAQTQAVYGLPLDEFIKLAEANELPPHPALAHLVLLTGARSDSC